MSRPRAVGVAAWQPGGRPTHPASPSQIDPGGSCTSVDHRAVAQPVGTRGRRQTILPGPQRRASGAQPACSTAPHRTFESDSNPSHIHTHMHPLPSSRNRMSTLPRPPLGVLADHLRRSNRPRRRLVRPASPNPKRTPFATRTTQTPQRLASVGSALVRAPMPRPPPPPQHAGSCTRRQNGWRLPSMETAAMPAPHLETI